MSRFFSALLGNPSPTSSASNATFGFQVLRNTDPDLPIEPFYDFIIGINGRRIDNPDPALFATEVRNCAGSSVAFTIMSAKGQRVLESSITIAEGTSSLGLSLQWTPLSVCERVWHVGRVTAGGPADVAGLLPESDYIIGSPDASVIHGDSGMEELLDDYLSRELRLFVYNSEFDITRLVSVIPSRTWGGDGALGCVIASNLLHRLPTPLREGPLAAPGESLFEGYESSNYQTGNLDTPGGGLPPSTHILVPAELDLPKSRPPPSTASQVPQASSKRIRKAPLVSPSAAFDEYFKEGEQNSREEDGTTGSSAKKGQPPPPPPSSILPPKTVPAQESELIGLSPNPPPEEDDT